MWLLIYSLRLAEITQIKLTLHTAHIKKYPSHYGIPGFEIKTKTDLYNEFINLLSKRPNHILITNCPIYYLM